METAEFRRLVDHIKDRIDIVSIIGQHIKLGKNHKARCPFHPDERPSFSVHPRRQIFRCFGCGRTGDVFEFLKLYERKTFLEILRELACRAGISLPDLRPEDRQRIEEARTIEDILTETARYYHRKLTPAVLKYLTEARGFRQETLVQFGIGYADGGLHQHLLGEGRFTRDLCIKAGVLRERAGGPVRDYFYQRIIFPTSKRGRVVHLTGRSLDGSEPKYLHLPGQIKYLFNEDDLASEEVLLAEGAPDGIAAVQAGYKAVAILGAGAFKPEFVTRFSRCKKVYVCLDPDQAGETGARKAAELLGDRAWVVRLPHGTDINEYLKQNGQEAFQKRINAAEDLLQYAVHLIPADVNRMALPNHLEPVLRKLAALPKVQADNYLEQVIRPHFKLKARALDGYRDLVHRYRKQAAASNTPDSDPPVELTALFDGLVDLVEHEGRPAFLVKEGDQLRIERQVERDGTRYVPPPPEQIPWRLARGEEVLRYYESDQDPVLYDDLLAYHKAISEMPSEAHYDLIVTWDFHTYLLDSRAVQYSPYIWFFAVPERGKSRTCKGMIYVAYRGIHVESLRDPYLIRVSNDLQASLAFDALALWRKAEKSSSEDILLHRFEKGAKVPRVLFPERGPHKDIRYYDIFGATLMATNEGVHAALETRAIQINMPPTGRRFEADVTPEMALPYKERLLAFRARRLGQTLPDIAKPASGRLGDILKPLAQVIRWVRPEREAVFLSLVRQIEEDRLLEKSNSLEAHLLMAAIESKARVEHGILAVKRITEAYNQDQSERNQISSVTVGRILRAMGFRPKRLGDGTRGVHWDEAMIMRLRGKYGLENPSEVSDLSDDQAFQQDTVDRSSDGSSDTSSNQPSYGPPICQTVNNGRDRRSDSSDGSDGCSSSASGRSRGTAVDFTELLQEKKITRLLIKAGEMLDQRMTERSIRWNDLYEYIRERHGKVYAKTQEYEQQIDRYVGMYRYRKESDPLPDEVLQVFKLWLTLRMAWIDLYSARDTPEAPSTEIPVED